MEDPPKKFFRLGPGREVRLRYAYFIKCNEVIKDETNGEIVELRCTYDPATKGGDAPDGRKVKATLHWVSAPHAVNATVNLYNHLFTEETLASPKTGRTSPAASIPALWKSSPAAVWNQVWGLHLPETSSNSSVGLFLHGFKSSKPDALVFNRTVTLRDEWQN